MRVMKFEVARLCAVKAQYLHMDRLDVSKLELWSQVVHKYGMGCNKSVNSAMKNYAQLCVCDGLKLLSLGMHMTKPCYD